MPISTMSSESLGSEEWQESFDLLHAQVPETARRGSVLYPAEVEVGKRWNCRIVAAPLRQPCASVRLGNGLELFLGVVT